jgi:type 1 fimbria pilin
VKHRFAMTCVAQRLALLVLVLLCVAWAPGALAAGNVKCTATSPVLDLPDATISANTPVGAPLGPAVQATVTVTCTGLPYDNSTFGQTVTVQAGNLNTIDTANDPPAGGGIMFKTSKAGVSLKVTASPIQASDNSCLRCGPNQEPGWEPATITYPASSTTFTITGQLIKTASTATSGTVTAISRVMQFYYYIYGITSSSAAISTLSTNSAVLTTASCALNGGTDNNLTVTLPTIAASSLRGTGTVAGLTPFNISYACTSGSKLTMTMSSTTAWNTNLGVISSSASCSGTTPAGNVGVQVLQSPTTPMPFTTTGQSLGNSPNGTLTIPYYAQYYQTGAPVTAGPVCATATFTMTYK